MNGISRVKIINAARNVFKQNGYRLADMRTIAREAGIAVGTIYNYYPNKALLYQAVLQQNWQLIEGRLEEVVKGEQPLAEKLKGISTYLFQFIKEHDSLWREVVEDPLPNTELRDKGSKAQAEAYASLMNHMRELFSQTGYSSEDVERMMITFVASVTHLGRKFPQEVEANVAFIHQLFSGML